MTSMSQGLAAIGKLSTHECTDTKTGKSHRTLQVWEEACWEHKLQSVMWKHGGHINDEITHDTNALSFFFSSIHIILACLTCIKESGVLWHHKALLGHQTSLAFRTLSVYKDLVCHHGWGVVCFPCGGWLPLWEDAWGLRGLGGVVRALQGAIGVGWLSQLYCRC